MANPRKLPPPVEHRVSLDALGFYYWQHRQEEGDFVYKRFFPTALALSDFLIDRYGVRFANVVMANLPVAPVDRAPSAGV